MKDLVYYNKYMATAEENFKFPGVEKFAQYFQHFYPTTTGLVDRNGGITFPFRMECLFPMPKYRTFDRSFESICNDRAREMLDRAKKLDSKLHIFWSGGIDSTLALVSLLKQASDEERENIVVLMTEDSILENPNFYRDHVRGKLRTDAANMFPYLLGTKHMLIGGECNDQLFGSDIVAKFIQKFGTGFMHQPYSRDLFFSFFNDNAQNPEIVNFYLDLFERLKDACPVKLTTNYHLLWWINFSLKWQPVYMRILNFVSPRNAKNITPDYIRNVYDQFYATEEFQLWSLNNLDKKIKDSWKTYKWVCKDIIYDYTGDVDYRDNKLKRGSLHGVIIQRTQYNFIDKDFKFYEKLPTEEYYQPKNDFI